MHVKLTNGTVDTYPYNVGQLRRDNPNTSFPKRIPEEMLAEWGVYPVTFESAPSIDARTQKVEQEAQPSLINGVWTVGHIVLEKSPEELAAYDDAQAAAVRSRRNSELADSDWTQVDDTPLTNDAKLAWATYRQALRDITGHANFPYLEEADWPTKPE